MRRLSSALGVLSGASLLCAGCASYNWQDNIERAEQRAKAEQKYLFVFYKWWLDNDSSRMISDVLNDQEVTRRFENTVNCMLDRDYPPNRQYMSRHGLDRTPSYLIVAPDGAYQKLVGYVPKEAFLKWVETALTRTGGERPSKPPPITPQRAP